jgi:tRNA threonylcarbamoyladenosine biosynthesis protein TsaE
MNRNWSVRPATGADAAAVREVTRAAFAGQETLDPPSGALRESVDEVAAWIDEHGGLVVLDGAAQVVAAARFSHHDGGFWLRRVAVRPDRQRLGLTGLLLDAAEPMAAERGHRELRIGVRKPLVANLAYWRRRGFADHADHGFWLELRRPLPVQVELPTAGDTRALGRQLAAVLQAGDVVLLSGDLGAGKTTLTQGLGEALRVRGPVTSPTFVIARVHPPLDDGPSLVHVDAYRLGSLAEVDDLDLDTSLDESVTVIEWGIGKAEDLAADRLHVTLRRGSDGSDESRTATIRATGPRWSGVAIP